MLTSLTSFTSLFILQPEDPWCVQLDKTVQPFRIHVHFVRPVIVVYFITGICILPCRDLYSTMARFEGKQGKFNMSDTIKCICALTTASYE